MYDSFNTCLIKTDMRGKILGSVTGLAGHLGCIACNYDDGKIYGSLEFKRDTIGKGILSHLGSSQTLQDGFYMTIFDVEKTDRMDMDVEKGAVPQLSPLLYRLHQGIGNPTSPRSVFLRRSFVGIASSG